MIQHSRQLLLYGSTYFFQKMIDQCAMKWKKHMMKARRRPHFSLEAAEAVFKQATRGDENDRCENSGLQFPAFSLSLKQPSLLELDRVYPNSKTRRVLAIFPNPNPKKPDL